MNFRFVLITCAFLMALFICFSGCTGTEGSENPLISENISVLFSDSVSDQKAAVENLIKTGEPSVIPLTKVFSKGDQTASTWAAVALRYIGQPSVDPLIELLSSGNEYENDWAVNTLASLGTTAVPALIEEAETGNAVSKESAAIALIKIGDDAIPLLQFELNVGDEKYSADISSIIQSIYATKKYQDRISGNSSALKNTSSDSLAADGSA